MKLKYKLAVIVFISILLGVGFGIGLASYSLYTVSIPQYQAHVTTIHVDDPRQFFTYWELRYDDIDKSCIDEYYWYGWNFTVISSLYDPTTTTKTAFSGTLRYVYDSNYTLLFLRFKVKQIVTISELNISKIYVWVDGSCEIHYFTSYSYASLYKYEAYSTNETSVFESDSTAYLSSDAVLYTPKRDTLRFFLHLQYKADIVLTGLAAKVNWTVIITDIWVSAVELEITDYNYVYISLLSLPYLAFLVFTAIALGIALGYLRRIQEESEKIEEYEYSTTY